jgi:hypothetical protein
MAILFSGITKFSSSTKFNTIDISLVYTVSFH